MVDNDVILKQKLLVFYNKSGHSGIKATQQDSCWKKMKHKVYAFVRQCDVCQKCKGEHVAYPVSYSPYLFLLEYGRKSSSMDFIEEFPKVVGKEVIFVVVNRLRKVAYFLALKHPSAALDAAHIFMNEIFILHGV